MSLENQVMRQESEVNPVTRLDYPDPDVIRVGDTYYMISTTMHFMPGGEILRSYDLVHWEHAAFVYERLDSTPAQRLEAAPSQGAENIYGKGMWAASLRFHKGVFYVCFVANDTGKTYLYTSESIEGSWEKHQIEGFYHDCSLLFDGDKVYIAYGNRDIYITQLNAELTAPLAGGLHRLAVSDAGNPMLGYEGAHFYKINGKYYLFFIHSLRDRWMRTEACFVADSIDGEFTGGDVLADDRGYCGQGVAQGGIVDTPDGKWYAVLFQDHGAVGRIPVLIPVIWEAGYPVFGEKEHGAASDENVTDGEGGPEHGTEISETAGCGNNTAGTDSKIPRQFEVPSPCGKTDYRYEPLVQSDDFKKVPGLSEKEERRRYGCFGLKSVWQFNHEPDLKLIRQDTQRGVLWIKTGKICQSLLQAPNILTQRMLFPRCAGEVTVDTSALKVGDYAGICALQGCYGMAAVTRRDDGFYIVMRGRTAENDSLQASPDENLEGTEWEAVRIVQSTLRLRIEADFAQMKDEVRFYYCDVETHGSNGQGGKCGGDADSAHAEAGSQNDTDGQDGAGRQDDTHNTHNGGIWKQIGITQKLYFKMDHFTGCRFGLFVYATKETGGQAGFARFRYDTAVE